ncbi:zinc-ribbon domain-containing protein [Lactobacillus sp. CC-MHH1034]|uniref:zinc-ribbon domain-containing protein n=1 Tax=Agrilactobacillus fermenti TaxID=2586909 RepID=UPI001E54B71B|nr:zinc-ribbon domain-containing protein [Agrilactobacillus fermenti]MCD2255551.1 zinc-ribbon domain-containing protein [Agrilactobacillus fermenti]
MGFCPNCGAPIEPTQNFCQNCGYPLSAKARKMVMGVTQKMLLMAPQTDNNDVPNTDENGILSRHYEPNTNRSNRQNQSRIDPANDPYLQGNDVQQPFDQTSSTVGSRVNGYQASPDYSQENTRPETNGQQQAAAPGTLNNYMTRSAYEQVTGGQQDAPAGRGSAVTPPENDNYGSDSNYGAYQTPQSAYNNGLDNNNQNTMTAADSYAQTGDMGRSSYSYNDPAGVSTSYQPYDSSNTQSTSAAYGSDQTTAYQNNYDMNTNSGAGTMAANPSDQGYYGTNSYASNSADTNDMSYGRRGQSSAQEADDYADDYQDDYEQDDENLTFFQKIKVTDYITAVLSIVLIVTNFVGSFITSTPLGKGTTLIGQMKLGGTSFATMMYLMIALLVIGPLLMLVFSIWKVGIAHILKLVAAVVSILAYIAVFGIMITQGLVAASGLQNFQFGISAIIAIVILVTNFILAVVDFVRY